jgi:hypothetical protein
MSGGIPREAVRLAELVQFTLGSRAEIKAEAAASESVRAAGMQHRRDVVTASSGEGSVAQDARVGVFEALPESAFRHAVFADFAQTAMETYWDPPWQSDKAWVEEHEEEWRRLLVQVRVAGLLAVDADQSRADDLQRIVHISSQSAVVAKLKLDQF